MGNSDKSSKRRTKTKRTRRFGFKPDQTGDTQTQDPVPVDGLSTSSSSDPVQNNVDIQGEQSRDTNENNPNILDFNFIMNTSTLTSMVELLNTPCSGCGCSSGRSVSVDTKKKVGLCQQIVMKCKCGECVKIFSSKRIDCKNAKSRFDVNVRSVICFRELGLGHTAMENFSRHMNMPLPLTKMSYEKIVDSIAPHYAQAAEESMHKAASNLTKDKTDDEPLDITASFDGSWQRRGYASLNGIVSCIERVNNKVVDIEIKTKKCRSCLFWEHKKDSHKYAEWKATHKCNVNHDGSAASMETAGTIDIFQRSIAKRRLCYTTFLGDGDSSSYPSVVEADPYNRKTINKGECIGHVQKRVGKNLRDLRKKLPTERKKEIFGKGGRLTDSSINYIQNCYGLAIRQNTGCLYQMKKNVSAILTHCSDIKPLSARHKWCSRAEDSWCSYWNKDKVTKSKFNIPANVKDEPEIVKIFDRLRDDELLRKCLHGKTQNVNVSFNGIVWTRCPKRVYVNRKTLEIGVYSAILEFNEGKSGIERVMELVGLEIGSQQATQNLNAQKRHLRTTSRKSAEPAKKRRTTLRAERKNWSDKNKEKEGNVYEAGGF